MIPGYVRELGPGDEWAARDIPVGHHLVIVDEFSREQHGAQFVRLAYPMRCRYTVGPGQTTCKRPAIVALNRGRRGRTALWGYCPEHLYGRRWDPATGRVLVSVLVKDDGTPA